MYMTFVNPLHQAISDTLVSIYIVALIAAVACVACDVLWPEDEP